MRANALIMHAISLITKKNIFISNHHSQSHHPTVQCILLTLSACNSYRLERNRCFGEMGRMGHREIESKDDTYKKEDDKRTVFVRGLDISVDDDLLTETFSSIGPVKHGFTVKKKGDGVSLDKHKGFGFVQFALEEDAVRAVQELNGTKLAGRVIKLESAHKRASFEERKNKKKEALLEDGKNEAKKEVKHTEKRRKQINVEENTKKHNLVKSVAIGGLGPHDVDGAIEYAKSLGTVEDVVYPVSPYVMRQFHLEQDGCSGSVALVQYATVKEALQAVKSLHGKQKKLTPGKKAVPVTLWARQISGDGKHLKRYRVVVRNLPFNVTEKDLRTAFGDLTIWEVTIPRNADGNSRGFAFVGFITKSDTEKAISKVNATDIAGRTVAVDWAVSKREFESKDTVDTTKTKQIEEKTKSKTIHGIKPGEEFEFEEEEEDINPEKEQAIINTVLDGILSSKDKNESASESEEENNDKIDESGDESEESGSRSSEDSEGGDLQETDEGTKRSREDVVNRVNQKAEQLQQALKVEKEKYFVEPGATVFIRNIPVDATQKTVFAAMKKFGFVKSTRLVLNKSTKKPKGTAFVDFKTVESANKASEASQKSLAKTGPPVMIAGKPVEIHIALGGDEIRDLAIRKSNDLGEVKGKIDCEKGRNLYLAQEGLISEGSAAWNQLSNSDKVKRARGAQETTLKLKSPNFAVSKTRLNVRNVPKSWDETRLKQLFVKAVQTRATKETPKVVQVKILREPQGISKGIAFIEFKAHDHALCALRELNNNPETWGKDHRPIIEFAIDNVQALKKRETNMLRQKAALERGGTPTSTKKSKKKTKDPKEETKSKRKLKMERRQMLKQRTRSMQGKEQQEDTGQKTKSQRRREQRKKHKDDQMVDSLASAGVEQGRQVSKKKRSASDSVEGMLEKKIRKTTANKRSAPEKRWFDK